MDTYTKVDLKDARARVDATQTEARARAHLWLGLLGEDLARWVVYQAKSHVLGDPAKALELGSEGVTALKGAAMELAEQVRGVSASRSVDMWFMSERIASGTGIAKNTVETIEADVQEDLVVLLERSGFTPATRGNLWWYDARGTRVVARLAVEYTSSRDAHEQFVEAFDAFAEARREAEMINAAIQKQNAAKLWGDD